MSKVIEYLSELNLRSYDLAEQYIYSTPVKTINSLVLYLRQLIDDDYCVAEYTPFTFLPNADISGTGGCEEPSCRTQRMLNFSAFTALYADRVYIKLEFITSEHYELYDIEEIEADYEMTNGYKSKICQDMFVIFAYYELIRKSVVVITPARFMICPSCFQRNFLNSKIELDFNRLTADYTKKAKLVLQDFDGYGHAEVRIDNIDEFFPNHPLYWNITSPSDLKLLSKFKVGSQIKDSAYTHDFISEFVEKEIMEACYTSIYCYEQNAQLITNKISDAMFFSMNKNHSYLQSLEESHKSLPEYIMPIVQNVDLQALILLREEENEAFI